MIIQTDRLTLRPFTAADLPAFMAIQQDPEVNRFLPWFMPQNAAEGLKLLHAQYLDQPDGEALAICLRTTDQVIGYVHVEASEPHDLGYGLRREAWGHGYMTEAAGALIAALPVSDYPFLTATHDVNNPKSGAVMQRLGMTYQYTYLEQWQPKDFPVHFRLYLLNRDGKQARQYLKYWGQAAEHEVETGLQA
ncbi:GNAT family N-acetyltransferase [Lacticaseibacillus salsurivasis]|uniref:GNAT family N-acetyltransferase n=1 Tax=Lacticaseibacillus salsurivasis TaxID=3081441 RepID=UPI0030C6FBD1